MSDTTPLPDRRPVLDRVLQDFLDIRVGRSATELPDLSFLTSDGVPNGRPADDPDDPYGTTAEWLVLPCGPTGRVRVQVTRPVGATEPSPVVLFLPGLGWSLGDAASYGRLVREFALGTDAAVVYVDYARAPAARYPVAVEQCYAVARWIQANGHEIGLEGRRTAAVGDSAGANLVAALTLLARQRGDVRLLHQVLLCPVTDVDFDTPSYRRFATGYFLHRDHMRRFWDDYLPETQRRREATAEADVLRDEGEAYAARLRGAGVRTGGDRHRSRPSRPSRPRRRGVPAEGHGGRREAPVPRAVGRGTAPPPLRSGCPRLLPRVRAYSLGCR
ncbi:alpha/beta hydrolase [Streptomyces sp. NPDC048506]|uniref:alpha/beta hydrolase n=1 Tax=Streptomyces sp. NPDC048506 TaxID=3155028 RepID=UPI00342321AC